LFNYIELNKKMYSKKEEWIMIMILLISFFSSNYMLRMYIESYTLFSIFSILSLNIIGICIITVMEYKKQKEFTI
jgi:hypothetical protein